MVAYECARCAHWHLCPEDRHTPSWPCERCGKAAYESEKGAERRAAIRWTEGGVTLSVYPCPVGDGYHLTKA